MRAILLLLFLYLNLSASRVPKPTFTQFLDPSFNDYVITWISAGEQYTYAIEVSQDAKNWGVALDNLTLPKGERDGARYNYGYTDQNGNLKVYDNSLWYYIRLTVRLTDNDKNVNKRKIVDSGWKRNP